MRNFREPVARRIRAILLLTLIFVMISFSSVPCVFAEESGFQFGKDNALQVNLLQFKGKTIEIQLKSGGLLAGKLSEVGAQSILLKELRGKEYYDALIVIDDIAAVIFKAR
jgi:hypothetical protein